MSRSTLIILQGAGATCSAKKSSLSPLTTSVMSQSGTIEDSKKEHHHSSSPSNSHSSNFSPSRPAAATTSPSLPNTPYVATTSSPRATPSCGGSPDNDEKRAAATEARRRRRLVLARRQSSSLSPQRRSFSPARRGTGVVVVPLAGLRDRDEAAARGGTPTTRTATPRPTSYPVIQPTIDGLEAVATRWKNGLVVAIPTECTYEACLAVRVPQRSSTKQNFDGTSSNEWLQKVEQLRQISQPPLWNSRRILGSGCDFENPYCLVTPGGCELKRHPILRETFSPRLYALRPSDTDKTAVVHRFNESIEVLERLANKFWPGPIIIRLGIISQKSPWTETPFVIESRPPPRIDVESDPSITNTPACNHFVSLRCPRHPLAVKARKDVTSDESTFLISLSIQHSPLVSSTARTSSPSENQAFCTRARQVSSRMAVLDGEDRREVFHVPTCEVGRPCETTIWLDGRQRVITVQVAGGASEDICSVNMVRAALRHPVSKLSGQKKERMLVQAILSKWKVVFAANTENLACHQ